MKIHQNLQGVLKITKIFLAKLPTLLYNNSVGNFLLMNLIFEEDF